MLRSATGRPSPSCGAALTRRRRRHRHVTGKGTYRGALEVVPRASGARRDQRRRRSTTTCGASSPRESPPSWPLEALKAQAVAARSYALSTGDRGGNGFDLYDDTRSQVYGGIAAETAKTNQAVSAHPAAGRHLRRQDRPDLLLLDLRRPHREHRELLARLRQPVPYLRGVADPYDDASPYTLEAEVLTAGCRRRSSRSDLRGKLKKIVSPSAAPRRGSSGPTWSAPAGLTTISGSAAEARPRAARHLDVLQEDVSPRRLRQP